MLWLSLRRERVTQTNPAHAICACVREICLHRSENDTSLFCRSPRKPRIHAALLGEIPGECDISHIYRDVGRYAVHTWNVRVWEKHYTLSTHPVVTEQLLLLIVNREIQRCPHTLVQWMMADMNTSLASVFYGSWLSSVVLSVVRFCILKTNRERTPLSRPHRIPTLTRQEAVQYNI